jgi:glycosyltransferase involved in cell wall biosynthesis
VKWFARHGRSSRERPRVLVIATHPIQYQAPWFRALAEVAALDFSVLFVQLPDTKQQGVGFGVAFQWDVPLLEGYSWKVAPEVRGRGGLRGFFSTRIGHPLALLRDMDLDVLILTGWHSWPLLQALIAAWWLRVPVVMRGESNALRRRSWTVRNLHRLLLGRCAAFLPIGKASHAFYSGYGVHESRLFDTSYFVDNSRFMESAARALPRRADLRLRWSIPEHAVCYCYAGKLEPKKRILDLLAAFTIARRSCASPIHLLVVGTGELMPQAKAFAVKHGLPVTFAEFLNQSEIPSAYVASDCLVLPSDYGETWGLVVNEAMVCGCPALVSDRVGCGPDLVIEGQTGAVFPFADVPALAEKLVNLAANPERLHRMGQNARAHVLADYNVDKAVDGTWRAIRHVLDSE